MQIQVSGRQIDIGDALRQHVSERLTAGVAKYFDNVIDANVTFSREGHGYKCDCSVHGSAGINLFAEASAGEPGCAKASAGKQSPHPAFRWGL